MLSVVFCAEGFASPMRDEVGILENPIMSV